MPSLAAHLGVRAPRRESPAGASVSLPSARGEPRPSKGEPPSVPETTANVGAAPTPAPRRASGVTPRAISRRGSLVARRNSTLASVAERLAEESRDVKDEAFDVPELDVPDPPATHLPTFAGKPRERTYRQPDGTLSKTKPARNPYAVAARKDWADLVQYARTHDGDDECTKEGRSFRYGVNVTWPEHAEYLRRMDLEPETLPDGSFAEYDPTRVNPLNDPEHPFHAYKRDHDARAKRREKKEARKEQEARDRDAATEEVDVWEANCAGGDAADANETPPLPMSWLDDEQRAFVREAVAESRRRYNERGGPEPIETTMTV